MGCEQSKAIRVQPISPADKSRQLDNTGQTQNETSAKDLREYHLDSEGNKIPARSSQRQKQSAISRSSQASGESLNDDGCADGDRGFSASSKVSKHSADSGLGEEYSYIITEFSEQSLVESVENTFEERNDLHLEITGTKCPTRMSAKEKLRKEESQIMQALREEGLIARPKNKAAGGVSFEIVQDTPTCEPGTIRPPARLAKLEKRRKKKKALTEEQIKEKLERAERRRKKKEEEMVAKIKEMEKNETISALEIFAQRQKQKEEMQAQKMGSVVDNKEKKLQEIRERMKQREKHAEEVRKRKLVNVDVLETTENSELPASS